MFQLLYQYFVLNGHVSIPGVGNFTVEHIPARIDFINSCIQAPSHLVKFKNETAFADKKFYEFAAAEMKADEIDAIKKFHEFAYQLKSDVNTYKEVVLPEMGILKKDMLGALIFEPTPVLHNYFPTASIEHSEEELTYTPNELIEGEEVQVHEEISEEEALVKRDYWWIYAIILGIAGIAAIAYYYMNN